jgi:hypothetical protein
MQGFFNPDLKKQPFATMDVANQSMSETTVARIRFQRLCVFSPKLTLEEKAEKCGLTVEEAQSWWETAFLGMTP